MERHEDEHPVLIAQQGPLDGQRWVVQKTLVIGRGPECDIIVHTTDKQVSRMHAQIVPSTNGLRLEDLGSKNGTHLNGHKIAEPTILDDGDTIQIALAQKFLFLTSDATAPLSMDTTSGMSLTDKLLEIDKRARQVWIGDKEMLPPLSVAQFTLLELLYRREGKVVTRNELIEAVWSEEEAYEVSHQALDALVRRLRDRLAEYHDHVFIVTVRGHGLRLENPEK